MENDDDDKGKGQDGPLQEMTKVIGSAECTKECWGKTTARKVLCRRAKERGDETRRD